MPLIDRRWWAVTIRDQTLTNSSIVRRSYPEIQIVVGARAFLVQTLREDGAFQHQNVKIAKYLRHGDELRRAAPVLFES